jgi:hypothetical protein
LSTVLQPAQRSLIVEQDGSGVGVGVVSTDSFDESSVTLGAGIGSYDVEEGITFLSVSLESDFNRHELIV